MRKLFYSFKGISNIYRKNKSFRYSSIYFIISIILSFILSLNNLEFILVISLNIINLIINILVYNQNRALLLTNKKNKDLYKEVTRLNYSVLLLSYFLLLLVSLIIFISHIKEYIR